jgi:hypothetical protein
MGNKPIIFSAPMVRALLDGRKTQTRRVLKPQPYAPHFAHFKDGRIEYTAGPDGFGKFAPYAPGDRLWVREAHAFGWPVSPGDQMPRAEGPDHAVTYRADGETPFGGGKWRSPIHMPRWASRLTLIVADVRVQRLNSLTDDDAIAEGAGMYVPGHGFITEIDLHTDPGYSNFLAPKMGFEVLWNSLHGPDAWDANPWVAAISFTVHRCNIDAMGLVDHGV